MKQVSHTKKPLPTDIESLIRRSARRLARAGLHYGHGTDNALDDAAALVAHAAGLPLPLTTAACRRRATAAVVAATDELVRRRIDERIPAVYLTGETFFAGLPFHTDPRALIPRSPLAELIERQFAPWVDPAHVSRVLDIGTGSGCIAIACAHYLPGARVDGVDIDAAALALARANRARHGLQKRVRLVKSDYFSAIGGRTYDIIVSNPPYVGRAEFRSLPPEYAHEPRGALLAGSNGLDGVRRILEAAPKHLRPGGILVVEVGNSEHAVQRAFRGLPFVWLQFERGGGGVFLLTAADLQAQRVK